MADEPDEAARPKQLSETAQDAAKVLRAARADLRLGQCVEDPQQDQENRCTGKQEDRTPVHHVRQRPADRGGDHWCDDHDHGELRDHRARLFGAEQIPHHSARQNHASGPSRRLHDAPEDKPLDRWCDRAQQRTEYEDTKTEQQYRPTPEMVRSRSVGERRQRDRRHRKRKRQLHDARRRGEVCLYHRQRWQKDLHRQRSGRGDRREHGDQRTRRRAADAQCSEFVRGIDGCRRGHDE